MMLDMIRTRSKLSAIGLTIDAHEFRAVQLMQTTKGISTIAWAVFPRRDDMGYADHARRASLPEPDELRWAAGILERRGFIGNAISIAPSTAECSSHVIELPPARSGVPVDQLAKMEVARTKKCGPEDFELGYWALPAKGRTQETLAVACPRQVIDDTIERFESAGFVPVGIDLLELAINRGGQDGAEENEINASLHIGWRSSLAVLSLGETVIYVRRIEHGASGVWDMATGRYGLSPRGADAVIDDQKLADGSRGYAKVKRATWSVLAAELARELDVTIAYVAHSFRTAPLGKIFLSGYGSVNPVIDEHLDKVLGIPIECAAPSALVKGIGSGQEIWSLACRLSTAYGLAARFDR